MSSKLATKWPVGLLFWAMLPENLIRPKNFRPFFSGDFLKAVFAWIALKSSKSSGGWATIKNARLLQEFSSFHRRN